MPTSSWSPFFLSLPAGVRHITNTHIHRVTRQTLPIHYLFNINTKVNVWQSSHMLRFLTVHFSDLLPRIGGEFFTHVLEIRTNHAQYAWKSLKNIKTSRMLAAALLKPSKQKDFLSPITTSTFCFFMCSWRLMKVVLRFQNQDALGSALWEPATSQKLAE